jgi:hypothetical protein
MPKSGRYALVAFVCASFVAAGCSSSAKGSSTTTTTGAPPQQQQGNRGATTTLQPATTVSADTSTSGTQRPQQGATSTSAP